ncbi:MAG TPA: acyltransferase [bacterium]|nr:acyltransferase [bacterium]
MIKNDVVLGKNVLIYHPDLVNLYGCTIGEGSKIGAFVEIRKGVIVGKNVKIQAFAFIPEGISIGDGVFIGPSVCFTNDKYPRAINSDGSLKDPDDWEIIPTEVNRGASIGANATILCGVKIGEYAMVAAGAVVTDDVPAHCLVAGIPARIIKRLDDAGGEAGR